MLTFLRLPPLIGKDIQKYPALCAFLFFSFGLSLSYHLKTSFSIPFFLLIILTLLTIVHKTQWKLLLFFILGVLFLSSKVSYLKQLPTSQQVFHIRFHTPPACKIKEGFSQKVRIKGIPHTFTTKVVKPLEPGEKRSITGSLCIEESSLKIESTRSRKVNGLRNKIYQKVKARIDTLDTPMKSYYYPTVLRETYKTDPTVRTIFEDSGLIHLMAISGLHVGIYGFVVFIVIYCIPMPKFLQFCLSALSTCLILFIVGPSPSTNRALIMFVLVGVAPLLRKKGNHWNNLGIAGLAILLLTPFDLFNPGFQLSFTATASVLLVYNKVKGIRKRFFKWISFSVLSTTLIFITTAPILLWHFQALAPASLLFNIVALPLLSVTFSLFIFSLALSFVIPSWGCFFLKVVSQVDAWLLEKVQWGLLEADFSTYKQIIPHTEIVLLSIAIVTMLLYIKRRMQPVHLYSLGAILTLSLIIFRLRDTVPQCGMTTLPNSAILVVTIPKEESPRITRKRLQTVQLHKAEVVHLLCDSTRISHFDKKISKYLKKIKVITTFTCPKKSMNSPNALDPGDTLFTENGAYSIEIIDKRRVRINFKSKEDNDCFLSEIALPYDIVHNF